MGISLKIFILCHNRPNYARQAIASVLAQTDQDFTLTISDNSSDDEVEKMVGSCYPEQRYIRRPSGLSGAEHFNKCIEEASDSDYFCLFHDDDLMSPGYVRAMNSAIQLHPYAIAIGTNSWTESWGVLQKKPLFQSRNAFELIKGERDMARRYYARGQSGISPFPSYIYKTKAVGDLRVPTTEGKYADTLWLMDLAEKGLVVWIREPLMIYRLHEGSDGQQESRRDRLRLLAHIKRRRRTLGVGLVEDYRCSFIYKPLVRAGSKASPARRQIAAAFLRFYRWVRYLRLDTYQSLIRRALVKWGART